MDGNNELNKKLAETPRLLIKSNDRITAVGKTGSGKSYLIKKLMVELDKVIFIDPKCEHKITACKAKKVSLFRDLRTATKIYKSISKKERFFIHIKPNRINESLLNDFLQKVFNEGNVTVIFDEVARFCFPRVCEEHDRLIRQGRAKGIGVWHLIQRPSYVDNYVLSEAEHTFMFLLKTDNDRKKMAGMMDVTKEDMKLNLKNEFHFYYDHVLDGCSFCKPI